MRATASRLTALARELTAEKGLAGFTVEELCEQAGISRRTFFNYFATKEDAVFGLDSRRDEDAIDQRFLAADPRGSEPFAALLTDLVALSAERWHLLDLTSESVKTLIVIFEREPRLLARMLEMSAKREQAEIELVEQREGLPAGDLRAAAAVQIVSALSRAALGEFLDPAHDDDFRTILERRLAAAHDVFTHHRAPALERI